MDRPEETAPTAQMKRETVEVVHGGKIKAGDEVVGWKVVEVSKVRDSQDPSRFQIMFAQEVDGKMRRMTYNSTGPDISRSHVEAWLRQNESGADAEPDTPRWVT